MKGMKDERVKQQVSSDLAIKNAHLGVGRENMKNLPARLLFEDGELRPELLNPVATTGAGGAAGDSSQQQQ